MDTAQWPQDIGLVKPMEEMVSNPCSNPNNNMLERRARPHKEQALNCPRCNSTNTKFCYYNNYSLTQPRYFCKTCRRYWTEGGSLRNVPVGGGSRKNRRSSSSSISSSSSASAASKKLSDHLITPPILTNISKSSSQNPKIHETQDLNLAFPTTDHHYHSMSEFVELPNNMDQSSNNNNNNNNQQIPTSSTSLSALEFLRSSGISSSRGPSSFMPMPVQDSTTVYTSAGFALQDFKPTLNFGLDGLGGGGYGSIQGVHHQENNSGRPLFPFEDLRQVSSTTDQFDHQNRGHQGDSNGYWSGMLGGGSW